MAAFFLGMFQMFAAYAILRGFGVKDKMAYVAVTGIVFFMMLTDGMGYRVGALKISPEQVELIYGPSTSR